MLNGNQTELAKKEANLIAAVEKPRHPFPGLSLRAPLARGVIRACCREIT